MPIWYYYLKIILNQERLFMFRRKKVTETRFLTRDEQGRLELWQSKPTFGCAEDGESFFVDMDEPENQISFDAPINRSIADIFLILKNICLEIRVTIDKKEVNIYPIKFDDYNRKDNECPIFS